ncbi:unnamed protein product [Microthlaspi erraticum]|uniref:Uncharacterized protein n=1 Tax=Microthlaspi erraticum TaxID=1685480 RepID=A0A6D2JPK9_9BRAS|nr:unnamed protein product [Microthlaspi erraticum]
MEVMEIVGKGPLRAPITLALEMEFIGKRSYNQKSEDCPDGSIENSAQTAQSGWPRNERFTLGQISSVRLKSRPKSKTGKLRPAVGHATTAHTNAAHDHAARAGKQSLAAAQPVSRTTADGAVRAGNYVPRPAENSSANLHPSDHSGRPQSVRPRPFRSY